MLTPPQPIELFPENIAERDKMDKMKLAASDMESEMGSNFQAYA